MKDATDRATRAVPGRRAAPGATDGPSVIEDAVILPVPRTRIPGRILRLAVLDRDGRLQADGICATAKASSAGYVPAADEIAARERIPGTWLFGGLISRHFGHQITRSMGRLPWLDHACDVEGILFCPVNRHARARSAVAMFRALLDSFGVAAPFRILTGPAVVERLVLGRDLFGESTGCAAEATFLEWTRARLPDPGDVSRRIYVSRGGLGPGVGRVLCEDLLEANLVRAGYEVFRPEEHPLPVQLRTYREAGDIVATDGSALHAVALARRDGQRIVEIARRKSGQDLLRRHLDSSGDGLVNTSFRVVDAVKETWSPPVRADNLECGELDFEALGDALLDCGAIDADARAAWRPPTGRDVARSLRLAGPVMIRSDERDELVMRLKQERAEMSDLADLDRETAGGLPDMKGLDYLRVLRRLHAYLDPEWYLEIGTFTGKSLAEAKCNFVAVDPSFRLKGPRLNPIGRRMLFFQETSDEFFASGFLARNRISPDLAFLDGLHHFEALLRDFMNAETAMRPGGTICLHDVCPTSHAMTSRVKSGSHWTGDVWKVVMILREHRPDLDISVLDAAPTGLAVIRNLAPRNRVLREHVDGIVARWKDISLRDFPGGLSGYYDAFRMMRAGPFVEKFHPEAIARRGA